MAHYRRRDVVAFISRQVDRAITQEVDRAITQEVDRAITQEVTAAVSLRVTEVVHDQAHLTYGEVPLVLVVYVQRTEGGDKVRTVVYPSAQQRFLKR